jgi:hypothetical protein
MSDYVQGFYRPRNPQKYIGDINQIVFRSSFEYKAFQWCDETPSILEWASEAFPIRYFDPTTMKHRRYFPDLFLKIQESDGTVKKYIVEIKPERQLSPPKQSSRKKTKTYITESMTWEKNNAKWQAAERFCELNGLHFMKITEYDLGLKKRR